MRLYLDTEFNGHGGELISMALVGVRPLGQYIAQPMASEVARDLTWFYEACAWKQPTVAWVAQHVVPKLGTQPLPPHIFRQCFHGWIRQFVNPEIVCDWHADAEHFCRMLAGPDYGSSLDFACRVTILNMPPGAIISENPHNALSDARALRDWYEARTREL